MNEVPAAGDARPLPPPCGRLADWWRLLRPFTLLPPMLGMLSGSAAALASTALRTQSGLAEVAAAHLVPVAFGALMAAVLNAASNICNQLSEIAVDRRNKPDRPLPAGRIAPRAATLACALLYLIALGLAALAGLEVLVYAALAALATLIYSLPPCYAKAHGWWANLVIAVPRGLLLKLAGWACVVPAFADPEAWWIGLVFFAFLILAASTKDFADAPGDAASGCRTLVVRYGPDRVARWMTWSLILPWPLLALGVWLPAPGGGPLVILPPALALGLAALLTAYGLRIAWLLRRWPPSQRVGEGNHPAWRHMYGLMMLAQIGLAAAYLLAAG